MRYQRNVPYSLAAAVNMPKQHGLPEGVPSPFTFFFPFVPRYMQQMNISSVFWLIAVSQDDGTSADALVYASKITALGNE